MEHVGADHAVRSEPEEQDQREPDQRAAADRGDPRARSRAEADRHALRAASQPHRRAFALVHPRHAPSVTSDVNASAPATPHSSSPSGGDGSAWTTITPAIAPGTLPSASHVETPRSTVPAPRCRQPPTVLVSAPYAMSVPTATCGCVPMKISSSGVISEPPPIPVSPTSTPTPTPKTMTSGSMKIVL